MNVAQEFTPLYRAAKELRLDGRAGEAALVTITRTRGSTFRRAGTSMLVKRDGRLVCELSGGCPQHDIVLRAHRAMDSGQPSVVRYGRQSNYDVMIETGCGGELEILIEPWQSPDDLAFLDAVAHLHDQRSTGVMASIFAVNGGAPQARPQRMVWSRHTLWTNLPPGRLRDRLLADVARETITTPDATAHQLIDNGKRYDALLESIEPSPALVIVGDGAGAHALGQLSRQLGWRTAIVPTRPGEASETRVEAPQDYQSPEALVRDVAMDRQTSVVVMTHRLDLDLAYVRALLATPVRYIGVIGSRQRAAQIQATLPDADERLHAPAGLDVGSETPQEIALAITAEILATLNGRDGGSLTQSLDPIHS